MRQKFKDIIKLLAVNLFLIIFTLFTLEIIFRIYCTLSLYSKFPSFIKEITDNSNKIKTKAIPDDKVGYRYKPYYSLEKDTPYKVRFSTNKYGHPGKIDYPKKKTDTFRIAVIGDSFASGEFDTLSWPESLEKMLENDQNWIKIVHGKKTEILNFSRSGIGFTQFKLIALHEIKDFEPDIILASFILDDFFRGIYKTGPAFDFQNISKNHNLILHEFIKRVWLSKKPNLIIKVSFGFFQVAPDFYSSPRSFVSSHSVRNRYHPKEAIKKSIEASIAIDSVYKCNFFIRHPTYDDFTGNSETADGVNRLIYWKGSTKGLLEKYVSGLNQKGIIVNDLFEEMKVIVQKTGVEKFFNLPHDSHPNDLGAFNYAKLIKLLLIEKVEDKCNL